MIKKDDEITIAHDFPLNFHSITFGYGGIDSVTIENRDGLIKVFHHHQNGTSSREFTGVYLIEFLRAIGVEMVLPIWDL